MQAESLLHWIELVRGECTRILLEKACEMWMHKNLVGDSLWNVNAQESSWECCEMRMQKILVWESLWNENAQAPWWREFVKWECTRTLLERAYEFQRLPFNFQLCSECDWNYILTAYASFGNVSYVLGHNSLIMFWWTQKLMFQCSCKLWFMFW